MNIKNIKKSVLVLMVLCLIWAFGPQSVQAGKNTSPNPPLGTILVYAGKVDLNPNTGPVWLICDGRTVSRTTYPDLFTLIGDTFGKGDGMTTFNLPDLRGRFLRGTDMTSAGDAGRDPDSASRTPMNPGGNPGNAVGSIQPDQVRNHTHRVPVIGDPGTAISAVSRDPGVKVNHSGYQTFTDGGGNETRALNAYVNFLIRVK